MRIRCLLAVAALTAGTAVAESLHLRIASAFAEATAGHRSLARTWSADLPEPSAQAGSAAQTRAPLSEQSFTLDAPAEVVATIRAACARCDWGIVGREGAALRVAVDRRYRSHVMLTRGGEEADYRILLGRASSPRWVLSIWRATSPSGNASSRWPSSGSNSIQATWRIRSGTANDATSSRSGRRLQAPAVSSVRISATKKKIHRSTSSVYRSYARGSRAG